VAQFFGTVPKIDYLKGVEGSASLPPLVPSLLSLNA
jgi:hypothetical protein